MTSLRDPAAFPSQEDRLGLLLSNIRAQRGQSTEMIAVRAPADLAAGYKLDTTFNGRLTTVIVPPGGVKRGQKFRVPAAERLIKVVSPANVEEGEEVDVQIGGRTVTVAAPAGGVNRGETFEIVAPTDHSDVDPHNGNWEDGLFDCFRLGFCHPSLCMSFWCPLIAVGQVLTRFNLNWTGKRVSTRTGNSFVVLALISLAAMKMEFSVSRMKAGLQLQQNQQKVYPYSDKGEPHETLIAFLGMAESFVAFCLFVFWVVVLRNIRKHLRVGGSARQGGNEAKGDFFLVCCCPTLTTAQLMRRTTGYTQETAAYFTLDGLAKAHDSTATLELV